MRNYNNDKNYNLAIIENCSKKSKEKWISTANNIIGIISTDRKTIKTRK